jgi:hypothetical protein
MKSLFSCFLLLLGSHRYARSSKRNAYATAELTILRGLDRTPRLKLAVQGGSVEQGMDEVVAVVGPVWESDQVQGLDGVKCCELI